MNWIVFFLVVVVLLSGGAGWASYIAMGRYGFGKRSCLLFGLGAAFSVACLIIGPLALGPPGQLDLVTTTVPPTPQVAP